MSASVHLEAHVSGHVQGVGFRDWTDGQLRALGLTGTARNLADGRVEVVADGPREVCEQLVSALRSADAPGRVDAVEPAYS